MKKLRYACLFSGIAAPIQGAYRVYGKENVEHVFSCEWDKFARQSFEANYHIAPEHFHKDVHNMDGRPYKGMVDIMVWGFPCTSYSIAGKRLGLDDPNTGDLFHEGLRVLKEVMPEWTIVENVKGLLSIDDGETIKMILRDLSEAGYAITMDLINTKSYGVPQSRDRVFIIGKRID